LWSDPDLSGQIQIFLVRSGFYWSHPDPQVGDFAQIRILALRKYPTSTFFGVKNVLNVEDVHVTIFYFLVHAQTLKDILQHKNIVAKIKLKFI
jgi:hypothetical protein